MHKDMQRGKTSWPNWCLGLPHSSTLQQEIESLVSRPSSGSIKIGNRRVTPDNMDETVQLELCNHVCGCDFKAFTNIAAVLNWRMPTRLMGSQGRGTRKAYSGHGKGGPSPKKKKKVEERI